MDRDVRILRIIARLNVGGPAIHVTLATHGLGPRGYETRLLAGSLAEGESDMGWLAAEKGVKVETVPGLGRGLSAGGDLRALAAIRRVIREFRPRIIHTHTAKAGTLGRLAAVGSGAKTVHTFHGHVLRGYFGPVKEAVFRTIERRLARRTDRLVVPSKRIADELLALGVGKPEQYAVIPLGFDLEPFLTPAGKVPGTFRKELGIAPEAVLVAIVGRLTAIKNHSMLLEAAERLVRRTKSPMVFALIGDGELRGTLEEEARRRGIEDRVRFAGWRKDIAAILPEVDVVALTSINEGTPVTLIEAMAAARPVVATAVGGVADVVEDGKTGLLVSPGRSELFAIALGRLADEPELRAKLGEAGRAEASRRFRVERLLDDLDGLYRGLLA